MLDLFGAVLAFIQRQVGLRTDTSSSTGSLHAKIGSLSDALTTKSAIKSIQRGTAAFPTASTATVTISAVTTSKSFLLVNNFGVFDGSPDARVYCVLTNSTTLTFTCSEVSWNTFDWQVIEFV